jgi:hypothetical protein
LAAHLHRYGTELSRVEDIIVELETRLPRIRSSDSSLAGLEATEHKNHPGNEICRLLSQTRAIKYFRNELESKTKNILALVRDVVREKSPADKF